MVNVVPPHTVNVQAREQAPFPLLKLPHGLKIDIFSRLPLKNLCAMERLCKGARPAVLDAWLREIPKSKRPHIGGNRSGTPSWKRAWMEACARLERHAHWGAKAAAACRERPDDLNPFEVDDACRRWIAVEAGYGGGLAAAETLEVICDTILHRATVCDLSNRQLHLQPPLIGQASQLKELYLHGNRLTQFNASITLSNLEVLNLDGNQIVHFDASGLQTTLQYLQLNNNRIARIDGTKSLYKLEELGLSGNEIVFFDASKLPQSLEVLDLSDNRLTEFDASPLPIWIEILHLSGNLFGDEERTLLTQFAGQTRATVIL